MYTVTLLMVLLDNTYGIIKLVKARRECVSSKGILVKVNECTIDSVLYYVLLKNGNVLSMVILIFRGNKLIYVYFCLFRF